MQPTLVGPRVTIRPIVSEDWDGMFAAAKDPAIWAQHPDRDRYQGPVFRRYFDDAINSGSAFSFVDNESGAIIGSSRFHGLDLDAGEIEIGWTFLSRAYWGGSFNLEIKQLMLGHAFKYVESVVFWVGTDNLRSRHAVLKIGGVLREGDWNRTVGDTVEPYVVYEIRRGQIPL
ncbi:MAG: GNAT family N-acetyltransferase [Woeseiaceae bacterium]